MHAVLHQEGFQRASAQLGIVGGQVTAKVVVAVEEVEADADGAGDAGDGPEVDVLLGS